MRLAELYFDQAQGEAAVEAAEWESAVERFEQGLRDGKVTTQKRPTLKTPRADAVRRRALKLYAELEQASRGRDQGRSRQIDRSELLYFYGRTLADLGRRKEAIRFLNEHVRGAKSGPRLASARLSLADLLFDDRRFREAIPHYLETAAGRGMDRENAINLKPYALYKLAWCYTNTDQFDKAVLALLRTIDASSESKSERRVAFETEARRDLVRAFVLAGQTAQGEDFFVKFNDKELLSSFRLLAADQFRDRRQFPEAKLWYQKLIDESPKSPQARAWGLEILEISLKSDSLPNQVKALETFVERFGPDSDWFDDQDIGAEEKELLITETATLLRRDAKTRHRAGQLRKNLSLFREARPFYELYFRWVPKKVNDLESRVHEMRFFYAELLFRLQDWNAAAQAYADVGVGRYQAEAGYARIVSLKEASRNDSGRRDEFVEAVESFVAAQPQDPRAADLLYTSAEEAFRSGSKDSSRAALEQIIEKTPSSPRAREAAERVLFLLEKERNWDGVQAAIRNFRGNPALLKSAGADFDRSLNTLFDRATFKKIEAMPEQSESEKLAKSEAFESFAKTQRGELQEKALNNALVYARLGNNPEKVQSLGEQFLKEFPKSKATVGVRLERAQALVRDGRFREALSLFNELNSQPGNLLPDQKQAVAWNSLLIGAHLQDLVVFRLELASVASRDWLNSAARFLKEFPRSPNRPLLLKSLVFRRGVSVQELQSYQRLPQLTAEEKSLLQNAAWVRQWRSSGQVPELLRLRDSDPRTKDPLVAELRSRTALAKAEGERLQFVRARLDYNPQRFGASLQKRVAHLDALETQYERIVSWGYGPTVLLSLERLADLYRTLARSIDAAPAAKEELAVFSDPLEQKALRFLRRCVDQGREYKMASIALSKCQSSGAQMEASLWAFTHEIFEQPRWIPRLTNESDLHPLVSTMLRAVRTGQWGELTLAESLLADPQEKISLNRLNQGVRDLTLGLAEWRLNQGEAAARFFRKALGSGENLVEFSSAKNLAALYILVGDYEQVPDLLSEAVSQDPESALLVAMAQKGLDQTAQAIETYRQGLSRAPQSSPLLFNTALALASNRETREAVKLMTRYIEIENPAPSHLSRQLLAQWRKSK
jgi:Tfp pilus assembly protein PilF